MVTYNIESLAFFFKIITVSVDTSSLGVYTDQHAV